MEATVRRPQVHIRYEGQSIDVSFDDLDVGNLSNDQQIKAALATYLNAPVTKLNEFMINRAETGDVTVAPPATFG